MASKSPVHLTEVWIADGSVAESPTVRRDATLPPPSLAGAVAGRMRGPGGLYNAGNAIALAVGLGAQLLAATGDGGEGNALAVVRDYLVGSPGATALSLAVAIFFVSGEMYHRPWAHGAPPDATANRWGDLLSGVAAVILTGALAFYGEPALALASGLLLAGGKLGNAVLSDATASPWPRRCRLAAMASRIPAIASLSLQLVMLAAQGAVAGAFVVPAIMLLCYGLWFRADLLLARPHA